jgi:MoxR-like ATPase
MNYKFNVGDRVKIVTVGYGCHPDSVGYEVTITELGSYGGDLGYKIDNLDIETNVKSGSFNGFIGEESFELVKAVQFTQPTINLNNIKKVKMSTVKTKKITKAKAADTRIIDSSLINKEEVFKMIALAEATQLPLLLVGKPGTAKTKTVIEYSKAWLQKDGSTVTNQDFMNKLYILETDEGTKSSEVKGMPDLQVLFTENKYEITAPISTADIVVVNEVDKASSNVRNSLLGVMNEKFLFNGKYKMPCKWKLFVATCNEIPKDELNSPFWDRFILKMNVSRVSAGEMSKYYAAGAKNYSEKVEFGVPNKAEIDSITIPSSKLEKFLEVGYNHLSDRTLTFVPTLARAVSFIWNISIDKALVKVASIMISNAAASDLQSKLYSQEVKNVLTKIETLQSYNSEETLNQALVEIEGLIAGYASQGKIDQVQVEEIEIALSYVLENHPFKDTSKDTEEQLAEMVDSVDSSF